MRAANILGSELHFLDINPYEFEFNRHFSKLFDNYIANLSPDMLFSMLGTRLTSRSPNNFQNNVCCDEKKYLFILHAYETMIP